MQENLNDILIEDMIFSIFDTETTGDNKSGNDKPIEIAVVKWNMKKGFLEAPKSWLVNPQMPIHPSAIAVHGLLDEDVENEKILEEILPDFLNYIKEDTTLVAHNINFDLDMLPILKERNNLKLDVLKFAKQIYKIGELGHKNQDLRSYKSQELRYWLNIKIDTMGLQAHRAAADILVTGEVFGETLRRYLERSNAKTMKELMDFINAPILVEKMPFGKFKGMDIKDIVEQELKSKNNYIAWLLKESHSGKMNLSEELKYTIEYYLKKHNILPESLIVEENSKSWNQVSQNLKPKMK
jgi:DNA polymerase III epsilon subunit-like protein